MRNRQPMAPKEAMIACALFCDSTFELIDGVARNFCLLSWRDGEPLAQYTSNLAGDDRARAAVALRSMAKRLDDGGGG